MKRTHKLKLQETGKEQSRVQLTLTVKSISTSILKKVETQMVKRTTENTITCVREPPERVNAWKSNSENQILLKWELKVEQEKEKWVEKPFKKHLDSHYTLHE